VSGSAWHFTFSARALTFGSAKASGCRSGKPKRPFSRQAATTNWALNLAS
jgi:hypothetical protein